MLTICNEYASRHHLIFNPIKTGACFCPQYETIPNVNKQVNHKQLLTCMYAETSDCLVKSYISIV